MQWTAGGHSSDQGSGRVGSEDRRELAKSHLQGVLCRARAAAGSSPCGLGSPSLSPTGGSRASEKAADEHPRRPYRLPPVASRETAVSGLFTRLSLVQGTQMPVLWGTVQQQKGPKKTVLIFNRIKREMLMKFGHQHEEGSLGDAGPRGDISLNVSLLREA